MAGEFNNHGTSNLFRGEAGVPTSTYGNEINEDTIYSETWASRGLNTLLGFLGTQLARVGQWANETFSTVSIPTLPDEFEPQRRQMEAELRENGIR